MRKRLLPGALLVVTASLGFLVAPALADEPPPFPKNPVKACALLAQVDPEAYAFLATKPGGCVSSLASVGADALMVGAFPSTAAAVGNCKAIEADVGGYPYQFYGFLLPSIEGLVDQATYDEIAALYNERADMLYARNRADCLRLLRYFHGGGMDDIYALLPPEFFEE